MPVFSSIQLGSGSVGYLIQLTVLDPPRAVSLLDGRRPVRVAERHGDAVAPVARGCFSKSGKLAEEKDTDDQDTAPEREGDAGGGAGLFYVAPVAGLHTEK